MRYILFLAPYIIIPFLVALSFRRHSPVWKNQTFVVTALLIFIYPLERFWVEDFIYPPPPGPRCGTLQMSFVFGNLFFFLPLTLLIQWGFNTMLMTKERAVDMSHLTEENIANSDRSANARG